MGQTLACDESLRGFEVTVDWMCHLAAGRSQSVLTVDDLRSGEQIEESSLIILQFFHMESGAQHVMT